VKIISSGGVVMSKTGILLLFLGIFALSSAPSVAQQLQIPAPSPKCTLTQSVGVMEITISYSRPGIKGREIFGGLVPYGEMWRTGANASTTLKFTKDVTLNGNPVPAGEYALFTVPGRTAWEIIISKDIGSGTGKYKKEDDVARFTAESRNLSEPVERFTITVANITDNSADIVLVWDRTAVSFRMETDTDGQVMKQIDEIMKNPPSDDAGVYGSAARYYFDTGRDLKKALTWINKSLEIDNDAYWNTRLKSQIQAGLGDYAGAITTAQESMKQAEAAGNQQYVKYNQDAIAGWGKMK
jgi:hypothetical protein